MDLRSFGWWYDRLKKRLIPIEDHAKDVASIPEKYRVDKTGDQRLKYAIEAIRSGHFSEGLRNIIIPATCYQGFIRIRWIQSQNTLGWQFYGNPVDSLRVLRRFVKKQGIGETVMLTFTDFKSKRELKNLVFFAIKKNSPVETLVKEWEK